MARLPTTFRTVGGVLRGATRELATRIERMADRSLESMQRNILELALPALLLPIGEGNLFLDEVFEGATNKVIEHRLERAPIGFIVVSTSAFTRFKRVAQDAALDTRQITLQAADACNASVYVF